MPAQSRDFGRGWRPGGTPGIQTRHSPGLGRCPGGTPSTAAVPEATVSTCGVGATMMVLVLLVQAERAIRVVANKRSRETSRRTVRRIDPSRRRLTEVDTCEVGCS